MTLSHSLVPVFSEKPASTPIQPATTVCPEISTKRPCWARPGWPSSDSAYVTCCAFEGSASTQPSLPVARLSEVIEWQSLSIPVASVTTPRPTTAIEPEADGLPPQNIVLNFWTTGAGVRHSTAPVVWL